MLEDSGSVPLSDRNQNSAEEELFNDASQSCEEEVWAVRTVCVLAQVPASLM